MLGDTSDIQQQACTHVPWLHRNSISESRKLRSLQYKCDCTLVLMVALFGELVVGSSRKEASQCREDRIQRVQKRI